MGSDAKLIPGDFVFRTGLYSLVPGASAVPYIFYQHGAVGVFFGDVAGGLSGGTPAQLLEFHTASVGISDVGGLGSRIAARSNGAGRGGR